MSTDAVTEARRQLEICNACRYCEGYCSAFPAITRLRAFADADITQIANLCHNCRGCYYACQYTAPHEFDLNLPAALATVRRESWEEYAVPAVLGRVFHTRAWAVTAVLVLGFALIVALMRAGDGAGFYAWMPHSVMVAIFAPAFLLPFAALALGVRRYWRDVGGTPVRWRHVAAASKRTARMADLSGGHGEGCNFEQGERFSQSRRYAHQLILWGFLLCFASTTSGTILHYLADAPAPYPLWSIPKAFGIPGGILLTLGCGWMLWLKSRADGHLSDQPSARADTAFVALLGFVGLSGLALYALRDTGGMGPALALHLGAVFALFVLTPYTKMAHGAYRFAALVRDAQVKEAQAQAA
ncbi:tricarballylate utilization 4Fe-4S protein TcuB [Pseudaestuariivita atlantica]|uniref:4Fe-4S ferredoxin n=1 Tax=Pseudaestuariivita atlantica TaxID=1317121 RepID=A0A0L1JPB7_9RHOB|nr:tricarballylate utilization 4Fe-4S protein TcuB [Pseudaestuariivita atlantica]KNG93258.1 4Fe-4S ferredoxin [Pseudaestuariivita atlantica]